MRKTWLIAKQSYRKQVRSGNFLILTLAIPVLLVLVAAIPFLLNADPDLSSIGYVDQSGDLALVADGALEDVDLQVEAFASVDAARAAVQNGEIDGFLVIPAGYWDGQPVAFHGAEAPNAATEEALTQLMRRSLLPDQPPWLFERLTDESQRVFVALDSGEEIAEGPPLILHFVVPPALGILFALAVLLASSQMGAAVVREKDRRSVEMIVTSLRIRELVVGKVLGVTLLTLTQFAIWGLAAVVAGSLLLSRVVDLRELVIPWEALLWALLLGVPGYFLFGTLAAGLGVIAGDSRQARQLAGMLGFLAFVPFYFVGLLIDAPDGLAAIAVSLFPLTSPSFSLIRMALTDVPTWQLATSLALLLLSLALALWVVGRIFRAAMLNYGKSLSLRQIMYLVRQT